MAGHANLHAALAAYGAWEVLDDYVCGAMAVWGVGEGGGCECAYPYGVIIA